MGVEVLLSILGNSSPSRQGTLGHGCLGVLGEVTHLRPCPRPGLPSSGRPVEAWSPVVPPPEAPATSLPPAPASGCRAK